MKIEAKDYKQTTETIPTFIENKRTMRFKNNSKKTCFKVRVDGGVISQTAKRPKCDSLLVVGKPVIIIENEVEKTLYDIDSREQEHFVELKGTDVSHGIEQLEATIPDLWISKDALDHKTRKAYCICTSVPQGARTTKQVAAKRFLKKLKTELMVKEKVHEVTI
ncbi:MAG: hypothetical protein HUK14_05405 [Muribaculaceae bacterium]|nr:hypothetical protein [Muribaculaceae bacterium]